MAAKMKHLNNYKKKTTLKDESLSLNRPMSLPKSNFLKFMKPSMSRNSSFQDLTQDNQILKATIKVNTVSSKFVRRAQRSVSAFKILDKSVSMIFI